MPQLPPVPAWDALHPLIIHFPIGLLLIAPLFILIGAALGPAKGRNWLAAALLLMVLGTASVFVAVETGEAAGKLAERSPQINAVLEHHEKLAERTRLTFMALTVIFALLVGAMMAVKRLQARWFATVVPLAFLLVYGFGALALTDTAHNGGRLVHEFGVHALVAPMPGQPGPAPPAQEREGE
jgi:uncharacterized membrane protein